VFGLLDQPRRELKIDRGCAQLLDHFRSITSTSALGPGQPRCASPPAAAS
jgi:hypothetical protein